MPADRVIAIPSPSLVVMVGPAGSGKSTFCSRHFTPTQVVSSGAHAHAILDLRLSRRRLTVLDATDVEAEARIAALRIAARHHLPAVAVVLDLPVDECARLDAARAGPRAGRAVIARHAAALREALPALKAEGFSRVHHLRAALDVAGLRVDIEPLPCDRSAERGPFDLIGDVHGCARELRILLRRLGYRRRSPREPHRHPTGRRAVFLGDLVDRGPRVPEAARLVMDMVETGAAFSVPGNHDVDLVLVLEGDGPEPGPGTRRSLEQLASLPAAARHAFRRRFARFVTSLPSHLLLDGERLAVAHAGLPAGYVGRDSEEVRRFALRGQTSGDLDRYGLPVRVNWAAAYDGRPFLVYGHTPVRRPESIRNTLNIDTGCVYGGSLTALRFPEMETVSVRAARAYYQSPRISPKGVGFRAETRSQPTL